MVSIQINGLDDVLRRMEQLGRMDYLGAVLRAAALHVKGKLAVYPPSRSTPGRVSLRTRRPMGYYRRGTGWFYPIVRQGSAVRYKSAGHTSETLGRKWTIADRGPLAVVVGNNVSYGPWVQSGVRVGGAGPQAMVHRLTGWRTVEQVAAEEGPQAIERVRRELERRFGSGT
jgi:hypothetical protein